MVWGPLHLAPYFRGEGMNQKSKNMWSFQMTITYQTYIWKDHMFLDFWFMPQSITQVKNSVRSDILGASWPYIFGPMFPNGMTIWPLAYNKNPELSLFMVPVPRMHQMPRYPWNWWEMVCSQIIFAPRPYILGPMGPTQMRIWPLV